MGQPQGEARSLPALLEHVLGGAALSRAQAHAVLAAMLDGSWSPAACAALLVALRARGEHADEIAGMAALLRERAHSVELGVPDAIDTCGTGGDGAGTFNISTAAAFVVAGAGVPVAKHGNRAVSSRAGSADVLEALGVPIESEPERARRMLEHAGFTFLFAPRHHGLLRRLAPLRRELGIRTILNALGPLANPAGVRRQLVGVYAPTLLEPMAHALARLGAEAALVVHGDDGLDEISLCAPSTVAVLREGRVTLERWSPERFGLERAVPDAIPGGDVAHNARVIEAVLAGERGPARDIVCLNAAAALWLADRAPEPEAAFRLACETIDSGRARAVLERLRAMRS
ncbi:MAG: anthranilate phosphoribosyltransferase [Planctomycetota bacterium]|nr:MAG: anthranilate phosphoribosyltransferase [Planctomycetota bacterium]